MRYPAFVGALKALRDLNVEPTFITGVSGGAIVATAYACGYGFSEQKNLVKLVHDTLPGKNGLIKLRWAPFVKPYGLYSTKPIERVFNKVFPSDITKLYTPLNIVTVDLETRTHKIWDSVSGHDVPLPKLVLASMSIPVVFEYQTIQGKVHVDGGVANNFPLDIYGTGQDVIGIKIVGKGAKRQKIKSISDFVSATVSTMIEASETEHVEDAMFARTVYIETDVSGLDFNLTSAQAEELMADGWNQTMRQLRKRKIA